VVGRRGGRLKEPLDHDVIVDKALELLARDGLPGMSLRSVASALDTGPASLYVYVADLQALHALVLDRALARVSIQIARDKPWRQRLEAVLGSYFRVLLRQRGAGSSPHPRAIGYTPRAMEEHAGALCNAFGLAPGRASLIRPDGSIAWRAVDMPADPSREFAAAISGML
jgi:AcrR family transcriptional regulator